MLPSPGNTIAANQRLFETVGAKTLLYAPEAEQTLAALLDASRGELRHVVTPVYAELMSRDPAPTVHALNKPFEEVKDKAVVGLHTSGTSGHPKPIYWTHGSINALGCHTYESGIYPEHFKAEGLETLFQAVLKPGEVVTMPFPMYHVSLLLSVRDEPMYLRVKAVNSCSQPTLDGRRMLNNPTHLVRQHQRAARNRHKADVGKHHGHPAMLKVRHGVACTIHP